MTGWEQIWAISRVIGCRSRWRSWYGGGVERWKPFARQTIGSQLVRAADSVGANIAESHGRFYFGEKLQFLYYARGSLYETRHWLRLAWRRSLLPTEDSAQLAELIEPLAKSTTALQLRCNINALTARWLTARSRIRARDTVQRSKSPISQSPISIPTVLSLRRKSYG